MMDWMLMPYRRYAEFSGRSRRKEYWMFTLFIWLVFLGCGLLGSIFSGGGYDYMDPNASPPVAFSIFMGIAGLFALASFVPMLAVGVRRYHDSDKTGWIYVGLIVLSAIPFLGLIFAVANLYFLVIPGTVGPNRYGPDPMDDDPTAFGPLDRDRSGATSGGVNIR